MLALEGLAGRVPARVKRVGPRRCARRVLQYPWRGGLDISAPVALAWNHGFSARELNDIRRLIVEHEQAIIGAWHEHCGQR